MKSWGALAVVLPMLAFLSLGCPPAQVKCPEKLMPVDQLVGQYNANAARVPQLWARARIELTLLDSKGRTYTWGSALGPSNGLLLMGKGKDKLGPVDFVLVGRESGRPLFELGTSTADNLYYIWFLLGENGGAWYGDINNAGAPGTESLLLDPMGLVSLLCLTELPADPASVPAVALTMSADPCAYVLTYIDRQPRTGRVLFKREIYFTWSDTAPARPFMVNFIAPDGRRVMTARLSNYQAIPGTGPAGRQAVIPTDIVLQEISWPGRASHLRSMRISLSEMQIDKGDPKDAAKFWDNLPSNFKQLPVSIDELPTEPTTRPAPATQNATTREGKAP